MPLVAGAAAFVLLAAMQFPVTWNSILSQRFRKWIKDEPCIPLREDEFDEAALLNERFSRDRVLAAVRGQGYSAASQTDTVTREQMGA